MLLILLPIFIPYVIDKGLSMEQVFQLQAAFAVSVLVFEVPSGYLADIWGRRRCLILGGLLNGLGYTFLFWGESYWDFMAYEVLLGAAASMYSGADVALLYDSLDSLGASESQKRRSVGNILASRSVAEAIAAVLSSILLWLGTQFTVVAAQFAVGWAPLLIALSLKELEIERPPHLGHFNNFKAVARTIFLESKMLRAIALTMTVWGMSTFFAVWLFQKYWQEQGIPLVYFGWLWAFYNLSVAISSKFAHLLEDRLGPALLVLLMGGLPIAGYLSMAFFSGWLGVCAGLLFQLARGIHQVTLKDAFNKRIASHLRATSNSVISFGFRGAFFVTGPAVGWSVDVYGLQMTLYILAGVFSLLALVIILPFAKLLWTAPSHPAQIDSK